MQACDYSPYVLPTIDFVGGETQDLLFHTYFYSGNQPFDMTGCTCNFSVVNFLNRMGEPIISKSMTVTSDPTTGVNSALSVKLSAQDTAGLHGKYVYQISIKDSEGDVEIPKQGFLLVSNNINKSFVS